VFFTAPFVIPSGLIAVFLERDMGYMTIGYSLALDEDRVTKSIRTPAARQQVVKRWTDKPNVREWGTRQTPMGLAAVWALLTGQSLAFQIYFCNLLMCQFLELSIAVMVGNYGNFGLKYGRVAMVTVVTSTTIAGLLSLKY